MNLSLRYLGRSGMTKTGSQRILQLAPNLDRDQVAFDAPLKHPLRFREAISALHDVVINDLTFQPRDKTAYETWKQGQRQRESVIRRQGRHEAENRQPNKPPQGLKQDYHRALKRYWRSRRELNHYLKKNNPALWRKLMPYDPVITVADDVLMFECFSADESSYGCLSVDRDCFGTSSAIKIGTTNVDYSWNLYDNFQKLRTYRETRFNINPDGFQLQTQDVPDYHEEKIDLPDGWLNGFMQLQSAMGLPMRKVSLSVASLYSLLAFLKRNKASKSPRAIRFELTDGQPPRLVLEPWERAIVSTGTKYQGPVDDPIRIWGRRRLLTLARLLPLAQRVDVYLLGTGLPSFWVVRMGNMRLTLGLSGWSANDWTRGSAVQMLLPQTVPSDALVATAADRLLDQRSMSLTEIAQSTQVQPSEAAATMNQLALRGQAIYDLDGEKFRWRQALPMALSEKEIGPPHPEIIGARQLIFKNQVKLSSRQQSPRGGWIVTGQAGNKPCEVLIDGDGMIKKGKCLCGWHHKFGIRNGPCRHLQAMRDLVFAETQLGQEDWYEARLAWSNR